MRKITRIYINLFQHSMGLNALKIFSHLMSLGIAILVFLIGRNVDIAIVSFFMSVLLIDITFFCFKKRESQFKSKKFYQRARITPEIMNNYTASMLFIRTFILMPACLCSVWKSSSPFLIELSNMMIYYGIGSFICAIIIAYVTEYKPMKLKPRKAPYPYTGITINFNPHTNWYMGLPGYNRLGVYTGSKTAIGGISD